MKPSHKRKYTLSEDPGNYDKRYAIPPELSDQLDRLYYAVSDKNNNKAIERLKQLIVRYPGLPVLRNYLAAAYNSRGETARAARENEKLFADFPDYLFARINKANGLIESGLAEQVPDVLGEQLDIGALYPDRDTFHIAEFIGFKSAVIRYYVAIGKDTLAEKSFSELKKAAPDHPDIEKAETYLFESRLKNAVNRMAEERNKSIQPSHLKSVKPAKGSMKPIFIHPEMEELYKNDMHIDQSVLRHILDLPHETLVSDLVTVLQDAVNRYDYFKETVWAEETHSIVVHTFCLLAEANATESLPHLFFFLGYESDFLEFWLGDHLTATLWQCFYTLGFKETSQLKDFLLQPSIYTYSKSAVSEALCQILLHHPERRDEIKDIYAEVLNRFAEAVPEDDLIDTEFIGLLVCDIMEANLYELLPAIKRLYNMNYVAIGISGTYQSVEEDFSKHARLNHKREVRDIYGLYDHIINSWAGYIEKDQDEVEVDNPYQQKPVVSAKIGRNDLCPCGSGKKYKKCCLKD